MTMALAKQRWDEDSTSRILAQLWETTRALREFVCGTRIEPRGAEDYNRFELMDKKATKPDSVGQIRRWGRAITQGMKWRDEDANNGERK